MNELTLPCRVTVQAITSSRYPGHERPLSWEERVAGVDVVTLEDGSTIRLRSDGMQSPPKAGWVLLLVKGNPQEGFVWTLYGLPQGAAVSSLSAMP
jgi:hypothetical protein